MSPSELELQIEADVAEVLLSDFGFDATYRAGGQGAGATVRIHLGKAAQANRKSGSGRFGAEAMANRAEKRKVMAAALGSGEAEGAAGVGVAGGIVVLMRGDTFEVPVRNLNQTGAGTKLVTVDGGIELVGGHWSAEVVE